MPDLGEPWLKQLAELHPAVYATPNTAAPRVIAGEHDVLFGGFSTTAVRAEHDKAPLRCVMPDPMTAYSFSMALAAGAPNEAAGQIFIDWMLSENGQRAVQKTLGFIAMREGFAEPVAGPEYLQLGSKISYVNEAVLRGREKGADRADRLDLRRLPKVGRGRRRPPSVPHRRLEAPC